MERNHLKKLLSYSALQVITEKTIEKIPALEKADMSKVRSYIFNGLLKRASNIKNTVRQ